jgi:hypothetical protein
VGGPGAQGVNRLLAKDNDSESVSMQVLQPVNLYAYSIVMHVHPHCIGKTITKQSQVNPITVAAS